MIRALLFFSLLAAVSAARAQSFGYAFEGEWDCGGGPIAFTDQTYFNGSDTLTMTEVEESAQGFVLRFADGYEIALSGVTDTEMEWLGSGGDTLICARTD